MDSSILVEAINKSESVSQILIALGFLPHVNYYKELRERCQELGLELPTYQRQPGHTAKSLEEVLIVGSTYNRINLKRRLLKEGLLRNECYECKQPPVWNNKPLVLQLDHINGINNDNRLENLRFLCPNCHTQTETFCGKRNDRKNRLKKEPRPRKVYYKNKCQKCDNLKTTTSKLCRTCSNSNRFTVQWPDTEALILMIKDTNFVETAKLLGCSDNAVRKHLRKKGIDPKSLI